MANTEVKWWETLQRPNPFWPHHPELIPIFQLTDPTYPKDEPIFVYADVKLTADGTDVTSLQQSIAGLRIRYPNIPIEKLKTGAFEVATIIGSTRILKVEFKGFMDDPKLAHLQWPQYL